MNELRDIRICFVGDSFVNGTGDPNYLGWTGRLCALSQTDGVGITHYNLGVRREVSAEIAHRWQSETASRLPIYSDNHLVFSFGVNDTTLADGAPRVSVAQSVQNLSDILSAAQTQYPTLMIGPLPIDDEAQNQRARQLDVAYADCCARLNVPFLSVFDAMLTNQTWMREVAANDGAHPRAAGYAALAEYIYKWAEWWF